MLLELDPAGAGQSLGTSAVFQAKQKAEEGSTHDSVPLLVLFLLLLLKLVLHLPQDALICWFLLILSSTAP